MVYGWLQHETIWPENQNVSGYTDVPKFTKKSRANFTKKLRVEHLLHLFMRWIPIKSLICHQIALDC